MNNVKALSKEKTHYRKAFDSPYLSSADIVDKTVLTVSHVRLEPDRTKRTKDVFNTAHFVEKEIRPGEPLKPMILNAHNSKSMKALTGSPFLDDWNNVPVSIYVDPGVRFGKDLVEGLRISTKPPVKVQMADSEQMKKIAQFSIDKKLSKAQESYIANNDLSHADADRLIKLIEGKNNVA